MILKRERFVHRFIKSKSEIHLPILLNPKDNILICLPEETNNNNLKINLIREYQDFLSNYNVQFFASTENKNEISTSDNCLFYDKNCLTLWKKLPEKIKTFLDGKTYRIALDLNLKFSLMTGMICEATKASILMTFDKPNADLFFNVIVNSGKEKKSYLESLPMIKNKLLMLSNINK